MERSTTDGHDLNIDFLSDFEAYLRAELAMWQITLPASATRDDVFIGFYDAQRRRIAPAPRTYQASPDLTVPADMREGYEALITKIEAGGDLTPHLSTLVERPDRPDGLLIDWNIYHFHLGQLAHPRNPRFVERTGPLLYAIVTHTVVYGLALEEHGGWASLALLETAHRHFPEAIAQWRMPTEVLGLAHVPSEEDILQLRQAGIMCAIQLADGAVYIPPGMGFNSTGRTSVLGTMWCDDVWHQLTAYEDHIRRYLQDYVEALRSRGFEGGPPFHFQLRVQDRQAFALEPSAKVAFHLGPIG